MFYRTQLSLGQLTRSVYSFAFDRGEPTFKLVNRLALVRWGRCEDVLVEGAVAVVVELHNASHEWLLNHALFEVLSVPRSIWRLGIGRQHHSLFKQMRRADKRINVQLPILSRRQQANFIFAEVECRFQIWVLRAVLDLVTLLLAAGASSQF